MNYTRIYKYEQGSLSKTSYTITGLLFEAHNELGRLRKEKYYSGF